VQVVEVSVSDQHQVNRRQVANLQPGLPQPLQHEQPARKVGVDENILPANLEEETGMPDECHTHLPIGDELWLMSAAGSGSDGGVAHQAAKLPGTLAKSGVLKSVLEHRRLTRS